MIWIIGQYSDRIDNSDVLLDDFLFTFLEDSVEVNVNDKANVTSMIIGVVNILLFSQYFQVQLSLLTAIVKLFIKRPAAGQKLVPKVLKWATEDVDNPDLRDRGYIYWCLLSTNPAAAKVNTN